MKMPELQWATANRSSINLNSDVWRSHGAAADYDDEVEFNFIRKETVFNNADKMMTFEVLTSSPMSEETKT